MKLKQKFPWTLSFVREWWPNMNLRSVVRLRDYEIRYERGDAVAGKLLTLKMRSPVKGDVTFREVGSDILTFTEVFKEEAYRVVWDHVRECNTVIDLGASTGLTTLYLAARYPGCKFLAVEPHPGSYQLMLRNLKDLIQQGRCRTLEAAVWEKDTMLVGAPPDYPEHYSVFATREGTIPNEGEVQTIGLSMPEIIAKSGFDRIDVLKIDIEGAEVQVFKGDLSWLSKVKCIAIAFHGDSRETSGFDDHMRQHGFRLIDGGTDTYLALSDV
jgi:FkbM family methyltransferase